LTHEAIIDVDDILELDSSYEYIESVITTNSAITLVSEKTNYDGILTIPTDIELLSTNPYYEGIIPVQDTDITLLGELSGQETIIDAKIEGTLIGEYDSIKLTQVGMSPDSIYNAGFGLYGENGHTNRTRINKYGYVVRDRKKVYKLKESYTVRTPENINPLDPTAGTNYVSKTLYRYKVTILDFDQVTPIVAGNIVEVTPLDGYFTSHYRNVGDLPTGMQNSWYNGSKQTSETTLDGGAAVQTFTTNPNTLKVSDTGRGAGEPILQVD